MDGQVYRVYRQIDAQIRQDKVGYDGVGQGRKGQNREMDREMDRNNDNMIDKRIDKIMDKMMDKIKARDSIVLACL